MDRKEQTLINDNTFTGMDDAYYAIFKQCLSDGEDMDHRAGTCREMRPYHFSLVRPDAGLYTGASRRMNYRFWAAETLCYLAGWGEHEAQRCAELLIKLNSNYHNFSHNYNLHTDVNNSDNNVSTVELFPMVRYGDGFGQGLARCYDTLKKKPGSRQAYLTTWDRDTPHGYSESPCLASAQYFLDRCGLAALYNIRSNDLNWGVPYDVASNCCIQWTLAGALGMPLGKYHHMAGSMHYYLAGGKEGVGPPKLASPMGEEWIQNGPRIPRPTHVCDVRRYQEWADGILREMHRHFVVDGRPGARFTPVLKCGEHSASPWISQWVDVIRWRHPK